MFSTKPFIYFILYIFLLITQTAGDEVDEYYGVPLGALHFTATGTSAEVYAADEFTVVFNHFIHRPKVPGCTVMMIGPPRAQDTDDVIPGQGVLIGIAQPSMRAKRQFGFWNGGPNNLSRVFDHLFMGPEDVRVSQHPGGGAAGDNANSFSGIQIDYDKQKERKNEKEILIENVTSTTLPTTSASPKKSTTTAQRLILFESKNKNIVPKVHAARNKLSNATEASGKNQSVSHQQLKASRNPPASITIADLLPSSARIPINSDAPRRAPPRKTFDDTKFDKTTSNVAIPEFWAVPDPHERTRQERLEELNQQEIQATTSLPLPIEHRFELPEINEKAAAFTLTNGAKITDYTWVGLYDHCERRSIPLISLRGIDPPREEKLLPLSGWAYNVGSYRVQILNCNTVMVPGFSFDNTTAPRGTYFYAGIGHFPNKIQKQIKINIIGSKSAELNRVFNKEDILLRLPRGYRTFDIDFINVYNEKERRSYGHVNVPSLLVPPCAEE